ncbi:MAG TPA: rhomboid family intramembrane serine protease [Planctomycetota bacterium]|nr:rhomboid family intramembrane serine protease [Planctomycetota bacterium]
MSYENARFQLPTLTPAIKLLLIINGSVFLANAVLLGRLSDLAGGTQGFWFAFSWQGLFEGYGLGLLRVLTYQFTHSFSDPKHILLNMLVLYFFGTMTEARLGYFGVLRLYVWGGFCGALAHLGIASLLGSADRPLVGASGACFAFLLYATCMAPRSVVLLIFVPVPLWGLAAVLVGLGVYATYIELATGIVDGVSHGAHLGGAALGALAWRASWFVDHGRGSGFFAGILRRARAMQQERRQRGQAERELQLDEILAKVKQQGLGSLSPAERRFLERQSQRTRQDGPS